jgi:hypothetical protein
MKQLNIHELLNFTNPDLTVYEVKPEDRQTKANISVADWKTALLAINVLSRRVDGLLKDVKRGETRLQGLEETVSMNIGE